MGRISPGPTRWPPGAERRLVPAKSNLKPQTSNLTKCWNTSTWRMTPWRVWWDAGRRPQQGRTWWEGTPLRAGNDSRRRSSATEPWQRARRRHSSQTRHGMASGPRRRSGSRRSCEVRRPNSARPQRASYGRSWRGKQPPSKRTSATCAHPWRLTASAPSKISGHATPRTSPSSGKPCRGHRGRGPGFVGPLECVGSQHPNAPHTGPRRDVRGSRLLAGTV